MAILWIILAVLGQAAALRLVSAGNHIHYQHYLPVARGWSEQPLALAVIGIQAVLVTMGAVKGWPAARKWLNSRLGILRAAAVLAVVALAGATVSRSAPAFAEELVFAGVVQLINLLNIALLVAAVPTAWLVRFDKKWESLTGRVVLAGAVWVVVVAAGLNVLVYERHPHLADEVVYLVHARYFAEGMLAMPAPPVPEAFDVDLMQYDAASWYCPVPPGWPAVLALGVRLGAPWLVNPLLGGLGVLLAYLFIRELYNSRVARSAALLLAFSPWYVFLAMSFMNHTATLCLALAAGFALCRAVKGQSGWGWAAGVAVGAISLVRPLEAIIVAAAIGLWVVTARRLRFAAFSGLALGCIATAALVLPYNAALTGNPLRFPMEKYTDLHYGPGSNALGFGAKRGIAWPLDPYPGHGVRDVVVNSDLNVTTLNTELFGWSTGSLVLMVTVLFSGAWSGSDRLMLAVIAITVAAYSLYWYSGGPDFGPRYWFLIIVPSVVLTVRGLESLRSAHVLLAVFVLTALAVLTFVPWRAVDKYHRYLDMRPDIRGLAAERAFGRGLVLVRGERMPDYMSAAVYNPVDLRRGDPVYAWDRGPEVRRKLVQAYPDRQVWVVDGPSVTGAGFTVARGPLAPGSVLP